MADKIYTRCVVKTTHLLLPIILKTTITPQATNGFRLADGTLLYTADDKLFIPKEA